MPTVRPRRARLVEFLALGCSIVVCFTAAAVGSIAVTRTIDTWYSSLEKPSWNPPNWLFAPVWTTLYLLMSVAAWLIWRQRRAEPFKSWTALSLFLCQLILNAAWSWIFFAWQLPGAALVEILCLWIVILATMVAAWSISRAAAWLLLPYLGWVGFATVLNAAIWQLQ